MSSIIAVAAYLKQSPLPGETEPRTADDEHRDNRDRDDHHDHDSRRD